MPIPAGGDTQLVKDVTEMMFHGVFADFEVFRISLLE